MKHVLFSVYDAAAEFYQRPFTAQNRGMAKRAFCDEAVRSGSEIEKHPLDHTLMCIGEFNDANGEITGFTPTKVITAIEAQNSSRQLENGKLKDFDETLSPGGTD